MPTFGLESEHMLLGVHPSLVQVCRAAIQIMDFKVIDGVRTVEEQTINVARGKSQTMNSKHLIQLDGFSHAVDLAPWPVDWQDEEAFIFLGGVMIACATQLGTVLRYGGDWNSDRRMRDEHFRDYGHFELAGS
jgi:peptidoglycan L-alanyl-D-glutamate endopeptidase CwlK